MSIFSPLAPYMAWIKLAAFVLACAAAYVYGGSNAKARAERACLAKENKALVQMVVERDKAIEDRNAALRKVDELRKPQREVAKSAKDNPSGCSLAKPTGDRLRDQIRATNDAIRSVP